MSNQIFRKEALEASGQIEDVQNSMRVTRSFTRIATGTVAAAILIAVGWSAIVDIPIHVKGHGLLVHDGGILVTTAPTAASGYVAEILVRKGDTVKKGETLARLRLTDREAELWKQQRELGLLKRNTEESQKLLGAETALKVATTKQSIAALDERITSLTTKHSWLLDRRIKLAGLQTKGVVSLETSTNARIAADAAEDALASARADRIRLQADLKSLQFAQKQKLMQDKLQIEQMESSLDAFKTALEQDAQILADVSGKLVGLNTQQDALVASGQPLFEIMPQSEGPLQAVVYVAEKDGKRLKGNNKALLTPANLPLDVHAQLVGKVVEVSSLPVTSQSLKHTIGDDILIERIVAKGPVFEVRIDLDRDAKSKNGYRWTSNSAADLPVDFGTPLRARVTTERTPLLAMAVPAFKRFFGETPDGWIGR
ncbi:NHLM bacteriocin system secretion protein [Cohaesibacter sp. ES.047]|uniref:NHLP bacteriocin system secretion protein n=1 Tax=Cohaesibacter sp. ES.047 TaxID=1798205 RepID=UPI000BB7B89A|nr:NHLP bacteriocin system secretion protein [Cohaesibacter sp. ES.047]SNY92246.1 NHLM bacteriocin system secretion protein [Cohaesibacter sp. ES.047]